MIEREQGAGHDGGADLRLIAWLSSVSIPSGARVIMIPNRNRTTTAPM